MLDVICSVFTEHCPLSASMSLSRGCRTDYSKNIQPTQSVVHVRAVNGVESTCNCLMLLHGIDTNKVNRLQILLGVTSLVDGDTKVLGVPFPSVLLSQVKL